MGVSGNLTLHGSTEWVELDSGTGTETAVRAAVALEQHYVTGITVSFDAAVDAAVLVQVRTNTTTILDAFYIPAAQIAPIRINYLHPLEGVLAATVDLNCPDPGATTNVQLVLHGFTVKRQ